MSLTKLKEAFGNSIMGTTSGVLALVVVVWVLVYWFMDECSFDDDKQCKVLTGKQLEDRNEQRNIQMIIAFLAAGCVVVSIIMCAMGISSFGKVIKTCKKATRRSRRGRR